MKIKQSHNTELYTQLNSATVLKKNCAKIGEHRNIKARLFQV